MPIEINETGHFQAVAEVAPPIDKETVGRLDNKTYRPREYLTEEEIEKLMATARKRGRCGHRDATAILVAFRHGLRPSELCQLRWDMIDLKQGLLHVTRLKNGTDSVHPISGPVMRALGRLKKESEPSRFVFCTERGGPMTRPGFRQMIVRTGEAAGMPWPIHPHMLRHSLGYKLANDGVDTRSLQAYFGHRNIQNTVIYTELAPGRFKDFWSD